MKEKRVLFGSSPTRTLKIQLSFIDRQLTSLRHRGKAVKGAPALGIGFWRFVTENVLTEH
jgi:hypothetical protein